MISYSTNFMGPISMDWYRERGLTCMITEVCNSELVASVLSIKVGDTYKYEDITTRYCAGRIDIYGVPGEIYRLEYGLPAMHVDDWRDFSGWLDDFETHDLWEFDDIIAQYEQERDTKIRWWNDGQENNA